MHNRDSKRTPKARRRDAERKAARQAKLWFAARAEHVALYGSDTPRTTHSLTFAAELPQLAETSAPVHATADSRFWTRLEAERGPRFELYPQSPLASGVIRGGIRIA